MAPAFDARNILKLKTVCGGIVPGSFFAGQKDTGGTIGNLPAVHFAHPTLDHRVVLVVIGVTLGLETASFATGRWGCDGHYQN